MDDFVVKQRQTMLKEQVLNFIRREKRPNVADTILHFQCEGERTDNVFHVLYVLLLEKAIAINGLRIEEV